MIVRNMVCIPMKIMAMNRKKKRGPRTGCARLRTWRTEDRLRNAQRVEVEVAKSEREQRLDCVDEAGIGWQHAAEQQVR